MAKAAMNGLVGGNQTQQQAGSLTALNDIPQIGGLDLAGKNDHVFPEDLGTQDYFVEFMCVKRHKKKRTVQSTEQMLGSVFLPLPANLNDGYQANYEQVQLGLAGEMGRGAGDVIAGFDLKTAMANFDSGKLSQQAMQFAKEMAATEGLKVASNPAALAAVVAKFVPDFGSGASAIAGAVAGQAVRGALVGEGAAVNPHLAQQFTGVNLRTHSFEFKLVPKSEQESVTLTALIKHFKQQMLPSHSLKGKLGTKLQGMVDSKKGSPGSRAFFSYPEEWRIQFSPNVAQDLYNIKPCVLSTFNVNYHGEGLPRYFESGAQGAVQARPVSVTIQMQFMETEIVTSEDLAVAGQQDAMVMTPDGPADMAFSSSRNKNFFP